MRDYIVKEALVFNTPDKGVTKAEVKTMIDEAIADIEHPEVAGEPST